jgi:flagellin
MSDIVLSSGIRSNLLSLQNTASLIGTTQQRLATGLKVNSALDNPTSYFTASSLNASASNLGNLLDAVSNAGDRAAGPAERGNDGSRHRHGLRFDR